MFNTGKGDNRRTFSWNKFTLKSGMLLMGVSVGIIVAAIISNMGVLNEGANYSSMILFFGGLSLVLYYYIEKKS